MESKFLYFVHRATFDANVNSFPQNLSPLCFIQDTNEIWFNNHFFQAGHDSIAVSEINGVVSVVLAESSFNIIPGSENISIKASGNSIIVSSTALTRIDTDDYLEWREDKLYHKTPSDLQAGTYGPNVDQTGVNSIGLHQLTVDGAGHITKLEPRTLTIRDYVEQRNSDNQDTDRQLLLAQRGSHPYDDTNVTQKAKNLTFNNATGLLSVPSASIQGGENQNALTILDGHLEVKNGYIKGKVLGDVEGTATPKIHLSLKPDFGGASLNAYGHVLLVDEIDDATVERTSDNTNLTNENVIAKAASPYAVKDYFDNHKMLVKALDDNEQEVTLNRSWKLGQDFKSKSDIIEIRWSNIVAY